MKKRGTGWIPDYPDIRDYKLEGSDPQNLLSNKIQSQGVTASIEDLAQKVYEALGLLVEQQNKNDLSRQKLNELRDDLEKKIFGDFRFETVELHSVLKLEMADSEVLLIKNYLQRIISTWKQFEKFEYQPTITDTIFDPETHQTVINVLNTQEWLLANDGSVGKDEMDVLALLAKGADIDRNIKLFYDVIETNAKKYQDSITKEIPDDDDPANHFCQGILAAYLFPIIKPMRQIQDFLFDKFLKGKVPLKKNKLILPIRKSLKDDKVIEEILTIIKAPIQELQGAKKAIEKDRKCIIEILKKIKNNIEKDFFENEIRELTEVIQRDGLNKKIIIPLEDLLENYEKFKDESSRSVQVGMANSLYKKFWNILVDCERYMALLYMVYPPEIDPELFQKTEIPVPSPIPKPIVELSKNKFRSLVSPKSSKSNSTQLNSEESSLVSQEFLQFIKLIVLELDQSHDPLQKTNLKLQTNLKRLIDEILAQILMPLGQYRNLSEAVERGIQKIAHLFHEPKEEQEERKNLIRDTIDEYNLGIARGYSLIEELHSHFENQIRTLKEKQPQTCESVSTQTKKLLFEISCKAENNSSNKTSSPPTQNTSQQIKNSLLFPINRTLDEAINKAKVLENQKGDSKCNQSVFLCLPEFVDLSYWCSPIEDQGSLNSCTAHAAIALIEYAQKKSSDTYIDASSRFLYKVTRSLMQREGDSGASVRDTMKAMVAFGVCPEQYWTYEEDKFDEEPTPFCYSFAENYKTLKYFRLDYASISRYTLLAQVKVLLASEIPCIFGFTLYNSVYDEFNVQRGHIPLPNKHDKVIGGHTVVAVGYHDRKVIENGDTNPSEGALLIRNSWGTRWGQGGYGWLPYDYIIQGLTADWWSLLKAEWLATGRFGAGASAWNPDKGTNEVIGQIPPRP
jgi:C1A family cysteine protease